HKKRLSMVEDNCQRLGINIVKTQLNDVTKLNINYINKADKVLVDVPCSGLGVLRRKPDLKWQTFNLKRFQELSKLQGEILSVASNYVKVGGRLIYSTCSTEPEENEEVVGKFLDKNHNFELEDLSDFIKERRLKVYKSNQKKFFQIYLGLSNLDLDGFFMSKMIRKG
ncbi:MAG: 16S rRNA (cytosine(967)-C(5))-methyltransferase RsmB, partial [Candidatus Atribacteria bacterium]|nr:16S rRNA (cytosine(967)-C(5))-methyltransferase RsmB [Candidatus Atribacteria bacterium]